MSPNAPALRSPHGAAAMGGMGFYQRGQAGISTLVRAGRAMADLVGGIDLGVKSRLISREATVESTP